MNYKLIPFIYPILIDDFLEQCGVKYVHMTDHILFLYGHCYIASLDNAKCGSLSFCYNCDNIVERVYNSKASAVMVDICNANKMKIKEDQCLIFVDNVKLRFVQMMIATTYCPRPEYLYHDDISVGGFIGPNVAIEKGVKIGNNVNIIGNNYIYDGTEIGDNVTIKPGTVIGGQGFGHVLDGDKYILFPQIGRVIIEDDVRIGANNTIDKGAIGDTIIKSGCRTDNCVHIAHNVVLEENCLITAGVIFSGSVFVGRNSHLGPSTSVMQGIQIGEKICSGIGSCIVRNVRDNALVYGVPSKDHGDVSKEMLEG